MSYKFVMNVTYSIFFFSSIFSGHGLSGAALLFWFSLIAVPFMFAGAIGTGFAMKATGALYDFDEYKS